MKEYQIIGENLVITIPLKKRRFNPYNEMATGNGDVGEMDNICGLIIKHREGGNHYDDMGFAYVIDRDYKGKSDDIGDFCVKFYGGEKEFRKLCTDMKISFVEI